ncbi:MAG: hypothetical protein LBM13_03645 [Candidatus Ancillula sp.]|jgi:hypothetical protein|nr:hypothetical protein [Candidatus Ancillula sp.]
MTEQDRRNILENAFHSSEMEGLRVTNELRVALVTGQNNQTNVTLKNQDMNAILTYFSPVSKDKESIYPDDDKEIDILIATDCISEGQNLQDCDYLINYDIHWNPVRIIQRFGRIDRIGSHNDVIQLVNFWPEVGLDEYINLKHRVESRMSAVNLTATGDDNPLDAKEIVADQFRKAQLEKLQTEVTDLEDMSQGVSIQDLGLNEFRLDLLDYMKEHEDDIETAPNGMYAVVKASEKCPKGVIFVMRNINQGINIDRQNRLHPFYLVYIGLDGKVIVNHLDSKKLLDRVRVLCRGNSEPYAELCQVFNKETHDGAKMDKYSKLLGDAIQSIVAVKAEKDIDSLFTPGGTTPLTAEIKGLDDFELIAYLVVRSSGGNE